MTAPFQPIKKSLSDIAVEQAHGGSGSRQVLFSKTDHVSSHFEAWTKGFLPAGAAYDRHHHDGIDEFWIVLQGQGYIEYKDGTKFDYKPGDVVYNPANLDHTIQNTGKTESEFYFIRLDQ